MVRDPRRTLLEGLVLRHLAVQEAQRVDLQPALAVWVQPVLQRPVIVAQELEVRGPALLVADGVEVQREVRKTDLEQPVATQLDDLDVEGGARRADRLDVELEELAVAALLWAVVAEHRADQVQPRRLRPAVQPTLEIGA